MNIITLVLLIHVPSGKMRTGRFLSEIRRNELNTSRGLFNCYRASKRPARKVFVNRYTAFAVKENSDFNNASARLTPKEDQGIMLKIYKYYVSIYMLKTATTPLTAPKIPETRSL